MVVLILMKKWSEKIIKVIEVKIQIIGKFEGMYVIGLQINIIKLLGIVIEIGIVVEEEIVVMENVERIMKKEKIQKRKEEIKEMGEVKGKVIDIVIVI